MFQRHSRDGLGLWLPGAPFGNFWLSHVIARLSIWLSINSSGKIRKHVKDGFSSTVSPFQNLCRDRFWQQVLWSEVSALDLLGRAPGLLEQLSAFWEHLQAFWEPVDSHLTTTKTVHTRLYYVIPNGCEKRKKTTTTTTAFNFTIKSRYRYR